MLAKRLREIEQHRIADLLEIRASFVSPAEIEHDLAALDYPLVQRLLKGANLFVPPAGTIEPVGIIPYSFAKTEEAVDFVRHGQCLLREGSVAVVVVAGGQGSRLGIPGPKGVVKVTDKVSASGEFAYYSTDKDGLRVLEIVGGKSIETPLASIELSQLSWTGKITSVDYASLRMTVDAPIPAFIADEQFLGVERVGAQQFARAHKMLAHGLPCGFGGRQQMRRPFLPGDDAKVSVGDPLGIQ